MPPALLPVFSYFYLLFLVCLLLLPWGALTPILFVSVSVFSLSNLISYSCRFFSPGPLFDLCSQEGTTWSPHTPIKVSLVGVFWKVSLLQGTSIPPPYTTPYLPPGQTSSNLGEAGHECSMGVCVQWCQKLEGPWA